MQSTGTSVPTNNTDDTIVLISDDDYKAQGYQSSDANALSRSESFYIDSIEEGGDPRSANANKSPGCTQQLIHKLQERINIFCSDAYQEQLRYDLARYKESIPNRLRISPFQLYSLSFFIMFFHDWITYVANPNEQYDTRGCEAVFSLMMCHAEGVASLTARPNPMLWLSYYGNDDPRSNLYFFGVLAFPIYEVVNAFVAYCVAKYTFNTEKFGENYSNEIMGASPPNGVHDGLYWTSRFTFKRMSYRHSLMRFDALQRIWKHFDADDQKTKDALKEMMGMTEIMNSTFYDRKYLARLHGIVGLGKQLRILKHKADANNQSYQSLRKKIIKNLNRIGEVNFYYNLHVKNQLWLAGEEVGKVAMASFILAEANLIASIIWVFLVFIQKNIENTSVMNRDDNCRAEGMAPTAIDTDRYGCSICGEWFDLNMSQSEARSMQACMDAVLRQVQSPEIILSRVKAMLPRSRSGFTELDLSSVLDWADGAFDKLLQAFVDAGLNLSILKFKNVLAGSPVLSKVKAAAIGRLIRQSNADGFEFQNQAIDPDNLVVILDALRGKKTSSVNFEGTTINDDGAEEIVARMPYYNWLRANVGGTKITPAAFREFFCAAMSRGLKDFSMAPLAINDDVIEAVVDCGRNLTSLEISQPNKITDKSLQYWIDRPGNYSLNTLMWDQVKFGYDENSLFNRLISRFPLKNFAYTGNDLYKTDIAIEFFESLPTSLEELNLNGVYMNEAVLPAFEAYLQRSQSRSLVTNGLVIDSSLYAAFVRVVLDSKVEIWHAEHTQVDAIKANILTQEINRNSTNLKLLNLNNNQIFSEAAVPLLQACGKRGVGYVGLGQNGLDQDATPGIIAAIQQGGLVVIDLYQNDFEMDDVSAIAASTAGSEMEALIFGKVATQTNQVNALAQNLATGRMGSYFNFYFNQEMSWAAREYQLSPLTPLKHLHVTVSEGQQGLDRITHRLELNTKLKRITDWQPQSDSVEPSVFTNRRLLSYSENTGTSNDSSISGYLLLVLSIALLVIWQRKLQRYLCPSHSARLSIFNPNQRTTNDNNHFVQFSNRG